MFKQLMSLILAFSMVIAPMGTAHAVNLNEAFNSLLGGAGVKYSEPGQLSSQSRNAYVAGSLSARFPNNNVSLFSVQPPRIKAGCGGVSAHFGGFSFINSSQIEQLIKNIAQNSVGLVIELVIIALCPQCEAVIAVMKKLAQFAAKGALDSCNIAQGMLSRIKGEPNASDKPEEIHQRMQSECGVYATAEGGSSDFLDALSGLCSTAKDAAQQVWDIVGTPKPGETMPMKAGERTQKNASPNQIWDVLLATGFDPNAIVSGSAGTGMYRDRGDMLLMMNMTENIIRFFPIGGTSAAPNPTAGGTLVPAEGQELNTVARLTPLDFINIMMCGNVNPTASNASGQSPTPGAVAYCTYKETVGGTANALARNPKLYTCDASNSSEWNLCAKVKVVSFDEMTDGGRVFDGEGFFYRVERILRQAAVDVRTDRPISPEALQMINTSSLPMYQAINIAAVYPLAGESFLGVIAHRYAMQLAVERIQKLVKGLSEKPELVNVNGRIVKHLSTALQNMAGATKAIQQEFFLTLQTERALAEQIRSLNLAIQQNVLSTELLGNSRYAATVNSAAGGQGAGTNTGNGTNNTTTTTP